MVWFEALCLSVTIITASAKRGHREKDEGRCLPKIKTGGGRRKSILA
jgi:hypothetical protein